MITRLKPTDIERIKTLTASGLTQRQVAERTGFTQCAVSNALNRPRKSVVSKWTESHAKEWRYLLRLRDDNNKPVWNLKKIAEKYGCNTSMIQRKMEEYGF